MGREGLKRSDKIFLDRFPPKPTLQDDLHGLEGASFCWLDPHMSHRERPRKILKFLRAKGGQTVVGLFSNFQKHHFRPLLGSSTSPRLDHRRYLTLSDSLGWDPKKFHEFPEAVQRVVQEMGVWFMG
jgi:hypothetical protein